MTVRLAGVLGGTLLLAAFFFGSEWVLLFLVSSAGILVLGIIGSKIDNLEKVFLGTFVVASALRIDIHLEEYQPGVPGFVITLLDVWWVCLMVLWFLRPYSQGRKLKLPSNYSLLFLLISCWSLVAAFRSLYWIAGLRLVVVLIQEYLLFLYLWNRKFTRQDYYLICLGACLVVLIEAPIGLLQEITQSSLGLEFFGASGASFRRESFGGIGMSRVGGTLGQPNQFGLFVNTVLFMPLAMMLSRQRPWIRILSLPVFLLGLVAIILTRSRGAWVGFTSAFFLLVFHVLKERFGVFKSVLMLLWVVVLASALVFIIPTTRERLLTDDEGAAASRVPMALTALNMIADQPVFGVGFTNYVLHSYRYDASRDGLSVRFPYPVHNAYLLLASEFGLPALFGFLGIMFFFFKEAYVVVKKSGSDFARVMGLAALAGIISTLMHWMVTMNNPMVDLHFWFLVGLVLSSKQFCDREAAGTEGGKEARAEMLANASPTITGRLGGHHGMR